MKPIFKLQILMLTILLAACQTATTEYAQLDHVLNMRLPDELGQLLTIEGQVLEGVSGEPIADTFIYVYHADASGDYLPADPNDESTAKYSGELTTNHNGEFTIHTIVPREYETGGNQHIHFEAVHTLGYGPLGGVILFDHDVNAEIRNWAERTGFGFIITLVEQDGIMRGEMVLELEPADE